MDRGSIRFKALDGLKGMCCIPIIFVHYASDAVNKFNCRISDLPFSSVLGVLYEYGWVFIYPFFWMSGFFVAYKYNDKLGGVKLFAFLRHRLKTIYPMLFFTVSIGIVIGIFDEYIFKTAISTPFDSWLAIKDYTMTYNCWAEEHDMTGYAMGVEWFVCALLLCYIYYYYIQKFVKADNRIIIQALLFLYGWAQRAGTVPYIPFTGINGAFAGFFGGTILYEFLYGKYHDKLKVRASKRIKITVTVLVLIFTSIMMTKGPIPELVMMVLSPLMIIYCTKVEWIQKIMEIKPLQVLGKLSTSVYWSHHIVIRIAAVAIYTLGLRCSFEDAPVLATVLLSVILTSIIYYVIVEKGFVIAFNSFIDRTFEINNG